MREPRQFLPLLLSALFAAALLLAPVTARAQDQDVEGKVRALDEAITMLFSMKKYDKAADRCREQIALVPKSPNPRYNLACALARLGKTEEALASLRTAAELGYDDTDHLLKDTDLESLRGEAEWDEIVAMTRKVTSKVDDAPYETGGNAHGVKSVEGAPEGGLRWRLLVSEDATAEAPHRLLVWLHPAGSSSNRQMVELAPEWAKAGWAVVLPTQKRWRGWTDAEAKLLLDVTLPDVAKVPGIDAQKPVLFGYLAGSTMALQLWHQDPGRFGGLILDSGSPLDREKKTEQNHSALLDVPAGDAWKTVPIYVVVGADDGAAATWRQVDGTWREAGVPLRIEYVEHRKHEWLIARAQVEELGYWLRDVKKGVIPKPPAVPR